MYLVQNTEYVPTKHQTHSWRRIGNVHTHHTYARLYFIIPLLTMSLTSNPLSSGGGPAPSSASASRTQTLKRSVQQAFDGTYCVISYTYLLYSFSPLSASLITFHGFQDCFLRLQSSVSPRLFLSSRVCSFVIDLECSQEDLLSVRWNPCFSKHH